MAPEPILSLSGIARSFGDLAVLRGVDLDVLTGEILGLIGPNGAGKTSLFNIISGFLEPDSGTLSFRGRNIRPLSPAERVHRGLVRSFQSSTIFPDLTVEENVALAVRSRKSSAYRWWRPRAALSEADQVALRLLADAGLEDDRRRLARDLSHGTNRLLDVVMALALEPALLLLDEPTAGLSKAEAERLTALLRRRRGSMTMIMIAHDLDIVFSFCDRIAVLDLGHMIAIDTPAAIRANPRVQAAYLGQSA